MNTRGKWGFRANDSRVKRITDVGLTLSGERAMNVIQVVSLGLLLNLKRAEIHGQVSLVYRS